MGKPNEGRVSNEMRQTFVILLGSLVSIIPKSMNKKQMAKTLKLVIKTPKAIFFIVFLFNQ
tara:strand:- start:87 stop:269 length:183 start_codon:yes stop_codon:yes gene_type:complete